MLNKISQDVIKELTKAIGTGNVKSGVEIGADYGHDEAPMGSLGAPEVVCEATSTGEVSAILRICNEAGVAVTPRGAGTGMVGGCVPVDGGVVLSMKKMNSILDYDIETMTVRVQPGVLLSELKADAGAHGFCYPPDPGEKSATVGGNAATNAGGPSAIKYGTTRDYIVGATVVLPDGEILKLGGAVGKNNSGYNLLQLVIGSEGTLGIITELLLKLIVPAKADVVLILPFVDGESCVKAAGRIRKEGLNPVTLEYIDTDIVEFAGKFTGNTVFPTQMDGERVGASLLVTLEGKDSDELDLKMEALADLAEEIECLDILVVDTPTLKKDVWAAHEAFHTATESAARNYNELNMAVPVNKMAELVESVKAAGKEKGVDIYAYGHAGDGGLHIYICSDEAKEVFAAKNKEIAGAAYEKCRELGGVVSSEHGIGYSKKEFLLASAGKSGYELMKRVKAAFDPNGILNPGKICTE
jgi:glycolate oxidase